MTYSTLKISILSIFVFFIGCASAEEANVPTEAPSAEEANVPTEAPYIVLNENLDEPNGYGFCLDTYGQGKSELMHTHSCKPKTPEGTPKDDPGHDVRFEYNSATKKISSYAFEDQCMQVLIATGKSEFGLLECSDHPHQKFVYEQTDKTIRLETNQNYCVAVDSKTLEAGPWVKRALTLAECSEIESALKQWLVVPL